MVLFKWGYFFQSPLMSVRVVEAEAQEWAVVFPHVRDRPHRPFLFYFRKKSLFGKPFLRHSAYMAKPSKLRPFYFGEGVARFWDFRISELRILLNNVTSSILCKNLVNWGLVLKCYKLALADIQKVIVQNGFLD